MKLQRIDPPVEHDAGNGTAVLITHAREGRNGLPEAKIEIWNGKCLADDVIQPDVATDRRKLAKAAAEADAQAVPNVAALESAILYAGKGLDAAGIPATPTTSDTADDKPQPSANFPGLVDVVADEDGEPAFLVLDSAAEHGVCVVREYTPTAGPDAGKLLVPPELRALPWLLPRAAEVLRYVTPDADTDAALFADVAEQIERHALLPELPSPHEDALYDLCAAFVMHTHYLEPAAYSPELAFYAVPERGKSRTGRTLAYMSRRGVHTETLREANLFRDSQDRGATLFLDCVNLWQKATKLGCEDLLLQRFERGARVGRVLYPEKGPFADTVYYSIFGPTILASNEPLGRILDTRCVQISMPLAPGNVEYPVPNEATLLPLRERLTAWRARQLVAHWTPAPMPKPAAARLGDVLLPVAQIIAHVAPDRLPTFLALAKHLESQRRRERSLSWEALIVAAVNELGAHVTGGVLLLDVIAEHINAGRAEKERLSNRRISDLMKSLGLETRKAGGNRAALVWDGQKIATLSAHYAETVSVESSENSADVPHGEANDANKAHSTAPAQAALAADPVSKVSIVSFGRGDVPEKSCNILSEKANSGRMCEDCGKPLPPGDGTRCLDCELTRYYSGRVRS